MKQCSIEGCLQPIKGHQLCGKHYKRWKKWGNPVAIKPRQQNNPTIRFWNKVAIKGNNECWEWTDSVKSRRYGQINVNGQQIKAHRLAYFFANGEWPEPECLHLCDNRLCCNPAHLEAGTHKENMRQAAERGLMPIRRGENSPRAKITENDVRIIRQRIEYGEKISVIAKSMGISRGIIDQIKGRKVWIHV